MTSGLQERVLRGVFWKRLSGGPDEITECGSVNFRTDGWSRYRRVVIIRRRPVFELQEKLFEEYAWEYEPIATTGSWAAAPAKPILGISNTAYILMQ